MSSPRIMTHLVASFPNWDASLEIGKGLVDGGSSFLEVQFPFSDPTADGPDIQLACDDALRDGFTTKRGFELIEELRAYTSVPIAVMSYANLIFQNGVKRFVQLCRSAGATAIIAPDLPTDQDEGLYDAGVSEGIDIVPVVVLSTVVERLRLILRRAETKLVYAALRKGITGSYTQISEENVKFLTTIKELGGKAMAGFGIRDRGQVHALSPHVDYVVVGTLLVQLLRDHPGVSPRNLMAEAIKELLSS